MKRMRDGSLTGGTGDVNPQFLSFRATQSAADTTTTFTQTLPIQRLPQRGGAQVMEVLRVYAVSSSAPEVDSAVVVALTTKNFTTTAVTFNEPSCFAFLRKQLILTTSGQVITEEPFIIDLSDGAGHGFLIATDNLFAQVQSNGTSSANSVDIKLLYRMKNVSLAEYIGIVQSQQ